MSLAIVTAVSGSVFAPREATDANLGTVFFEGLLEAATSGAGKMGVAILMSQQGPVAIGRAIGSTVLIEATVAAASKLYEAKAGAEGKADVLSDFIRTSIENMSVNDEFMLTRFG